MIYSAFVREEQHYKKKDLRTIFGPKSIDEIKKIIRRLKEYGIVKILPIKRNEQDIYEFTEGEALDNFHYAFSFVGLIMIEEILLKCYPKYINNEKPIEELKQVLKVLQKYSKSKEQNLEKYNNADGTSLNRISLLIYLINDYYDNGLYTNAKEVIEVNGMGEIDWSRTINYTYPIISDNSPYYIELQTRKKINDFNDFFMRLHQCILTKCSDVLKEANLLELFELDELNLSSEKIEDLGDDDYLVARIEKELNVQFNTRKQLLLNLMIAFIKQSSSIEGKSDINLFGYKDFDRVWEDVCKQTFNNQLKTDIAKLPFTKIPPNVKTLFDIVEKPKWGTKKNPIYASKSLELDLVSIVQDKEKIAFCIFDAKYYLISFSEGNVEHQPGVEDVRKQYFYQLAYKSFLDANGIDTIKNCFLMPTEKEEIQLFGNYAWFDMFNLNGLKLADIQLRELPARQMFDLYLSNKKFDISKLKL